MTVKMTVRERRWRQAIVDLLDTRVRDDEDRPNTVLSLLLERESLAGQLPAFEEIKDLLGNKPIRGQICICGHDRKLHSMDRACLSLSNRWTCGCDRFERATMQRVADLALMSDKEIVSNGRRRAR